MRLARPTTQSKSVFELRAGLQIGAPVAGVHVADADEDRRADEGAPLLPEAGLVVGHFDGAVHVFEGNGWRALRRGDGCGGQGRLLGIRLEDSFQGC